MISQCSQCTHFPQESQWGHTEEGQESWISQSFLQESRWGYTGEDQWISQCSQCYHSYSQGAGWQPTHLSAQLSHGIKLRLRLVLRLVVRINGSVSVEIRDFNCMMCKMCHSTVAQSYLHSTSCCSYSTSHCFSTMAASASHPKPSAAPTPAPVLESDPEYSPITLPPQPETVVSSDSSSTSSSDSDFTWGVKDLPVMAAVDKLLEQPELSPTRTAQFRKLDEMNQVHAMFCPSWTQIVKDHSCVYDLSGSPQLEEPGMTMKFIHTSYKTLEKMVSRGSLGQRFMFTSPMSAALHRVTHHHFELKFVAEKGQGVQNGFSGSVSIDINSVTVAKIAVVRLSQIAPSIIQELASDNVVALSPRR
eukprot:6490325-Amphidinium_carterae.3